MIVTAFLSMWICNGGSTAIMLPIVDAVLTEIERQSCPRKARRASDQSSGLENNGIESNGTVKSKKEEEEGGEDRSKENEGGILETNHLSFEIYRHM